MVSPTNPFREYIMWRSRVVVYVAAALVVIALVGLALVVFASSIQVNRFGLLLQLIGVLALVPDIIGKEFFTRQPVVPQPIQQAAETPSGVPADDSPAAPNEGPAGGQGGGTANPSQPPAEEPAKMPPVPSQMGPTGAELPDAAAPATEPAAGAPSLAQADDRFDFYQSHNRLIILGNAIAALCLIGWMAGSFLDPQSLRFPEEIYIRELLGFAGFAWINSYFLIHIYRAIQPTIPAVVLGTFFSLDMALSVMGVVFAGAFYVVAGWLRGALDYVYGSGARRVLRWVTLPLFALGLLLELAATFWR